MRRNGTEIPVPKAHEFAQPKATPSLLHASQFWFDPEGRTKIAQRFIAGLPNPPRIRIRPVVGYRKIARNADFERPSGTQKARYCPSSRQ